MSLVLTSGLKLDESKELADFFDNAPIGMLWVAADGTVLKANKYKLEMLGYAEEEFVGKNISEFHPDKQNLQEALERISTGETLEGYVVELLCKDGSTKKLLLNSNARFDGELLIHTRCITRPLT